MSKHASLKLYLYFLVALLPISNCEGAVPVKDKSDGELLSVIVLSRHGERIPRKLYTTDPYKDSPLWGASPGQLVNAGKVRQYEVGKWLRARYEGFLPETYSAKDIYVRSTDTDRTLMSAATTLAGLYPPKGEQVWNQDILWQPIPIHTVPSKDDQVLLMKTYCPKFDKLHDELLESEYFVNIHNKNEKLYQRLSYYTGDDIRNIIDVENVYNILAVERYYFNFTLPHWTKGIFPEKMEFLAMLSFSRFCHTQDLTRLSVGVFLDYIITHFENVLTNPNDNPKFILLVGHAYGVGFTLMALEWFKNLMPLSGSTLIFELRKINGENVVNVFYRRIDELEKVTLNSCEFNCKIEDFKKTFKNITVSMAQREKECIV